ncbi:MAG: hypothetical protein M5T52_00590 [Ignavibacteriaceae bacterium]|nr:hypothetical protein [Ignavibacteriaceae bacterium]
MKIILTNVDIIHPEENLNLKGVSVLLDSGIISKIGQLSNEEKSGAKEFNFSEKILVPGFLICTYI